MWIALRRILWPRFVRRPLRRFARRPFGRLAGHFLGRIAHSQESASSEFEFGAGFLLGILSAPGSLYCFLLFQKYSSLLNFLRGGGRQNVYFASLPDKFFLISMAMSVTGIVTALKWDQLLPDSQDYLNLAPLPIQPRRFLLANAAAILIAVVVLALDVSAVPSVLFPVFAMTSVRATPAAFLQFGAAHAASVLLASLFAICGVFALLGTLSALLPRELFRACSPWIRGVLVVVLLMLLPIAFAGSAVILGLARHPDSLARFLPPMWYLGLCQNLQHHPVPGISPLAHTGIVAIPVVCGLMAITYAFSYRRRFAEVLEGGRRPAEQRLFALVLAVLDLFARRAPGFQRACHRFAVRALMRNEAHRMAIAVAVSLGWLLAAQDIAGAPLSSPQLAAPLAAAYILIFGLRVAFELPAGVPANWIFRAVLDPRENDSLPVARRLMFSFLTPLVVLPGFVYGLIVSGLAAAVLQTLFLLALSVCLIDLQLAGYRKVPLTCPMPGFRDNLLMLCLVQFLGYALFTRGGAALEAWMLEGPWRLLLLPAAMCGAWFWNRRRIADAREAGELEEGVTFENLPVRAVERLNLSDGM